MDREELEERVRRRPGENAFRRGSSADEAGARPGYVPFQPEPEDALALRGAEEAAAHVDNLPEGPGAGSAASQPGEPVIAGEAPAQPPWPEADRDEPEPEPIPEPEPVVAAPYEPAPPENVGEPSTAPPYPPEAYEEVPYGEPEDAYAYPYAATGDRGGDGRNALPIIGFVILCVMALAVGAVLAGLLGGEEPVGQASPSATVQASQEPSLPPSTQPSSAPSESAGQATPVPEDGPVVFPDGATYEVLPCGSYEFLDDLSGCTVDGSTRDSGEVWVLVVFDDAAGSDSLRLQLRSGNETLNEQERPLSDSVTCGDRCDGLIWGAIYQDLLPGEYELVLERNGDFADRAQFVVED